MNDNEYNENFERPHHHINKPNRCCSCFNLAFLFVSILALTLSIYLNYLNYSEKKGVWLDLIKKVFNHSSDNEKLKILEMYVEIYDKLIDPEISKKYKDEIKLNSFQIQKEIGLIKLKKNYNDIRTNIIHSLPEFEKANLLLMNINKTESQKFTQKCIDVIKYYIQTHKDDFELNGLINKCTS